MRVRRAALYFAPDRDQLAAGLMRSGPSSRMPASNWAFKPGHADHEELVQVRAEDRQEPHPFEQRIGGVLRLFEHPALESQQRQLAVQV